MEQNREKYFNDVTRVTSLIDLKSREYQALVEKYEDMNKTNK